MSIVVIALATYAIAWFALALSDRRSWSGVADELSGPGTVASEYDAQRPAKAA